MLNEITRNSQHCCVVAVAQCVRCFAHIHSLIIAPGWLDVERCVSLSEWERYKWSCTMRYLSFVKLHFIYRTKIISPFQLNHNTLTYPKAILPPVCLEWPLFTQLMEGRGWPDTWHSSTTRAPTGTVNTWGHSFTDGGAARKRKELTYATGGKKYWYGIYCILLCWEMIIKSLRPNLNIS